MLNRRAMLQATGAALLGSPAWRLIAAPLITSPAGLIFATIEVNGQAAKALIDTGGGRGIQLSSTLAERLGIPLSETGRTTQRYDGAHPVLGGRIVSLAFDSVTLRDVEIAVLPDDIESIGRQTGEPFDAILGWPLLSRQGFVIDYHAGAITLAGAAPAGGLTLPLEPGRPQPVTAGTLGGQAINFLIDTGAPHSNVDQSLANGAAVGGRVDLSFEVGGRAFTANFRVRDLSPMTRGLGARAVIGHAFLQAYRFVWSPAESAIRLL